MRWAVIVVGSRGYANYRHQADACHAYTALRARGIPRGNLVLFSFDDAAWAPQNPLPGTLFNAPDGEDVRGHCHVDYRGAAVTVDAFMDAMLPAPRSATGSFTGKTLGSSSTDSVFVYFVDHGASQMLLFPSGEIFPASELHVLLRLLRLRRKFRRLLLFVEACESGSLFENFPLPDAVLAVTAANATESSWGTFCPSSSDFRSDVVRQSDVPLNTCLGDLFSVNWIRALEISSKFNAETVREFLVRVASATEKSEVNYYGDERILDLPISEFFGDPVKAYVFDCEGFLEGHSSNSQWAQDWFIAHNLPVARNEGIFVEIGAYHPHVLSNSLALEKCLGYRGLCIEPNPENGAKFRDERSCEFVNHCVWSERKFLELKLDGDPIEAALQETSEEKFPGRTVSVECLSLLDVLEIARRNFRSSVVDVLLIDAEGSELEILRNFRAAVEQFDIRLVIVEVSKIGSSIELQQVFFENNYEKIAVLGGDWAFRKRVPLP